MDAAVTLQQKKTIKFLCIVDFPLSKQGIFFVTLTHKAVMKKLSQSFLLYCRAKKIGCFKNVFDFAAIDGEAFSGDFDI